MPMNARPRRRWAMAGIVIAVFASHPGAASAGLRSPWDTPIALRSLPGNHPCPRPPTLPTGIETSDYYSDRAHSIIDPARQHAYEQSIRRWHKAATEVDRMADRYRAHGDGARAVCVASWLDHFAGAGALTGAMSSNQATYVQGWMLGSFAIAWLKVRTDPAIPAAARNRITAWLATVGALNRAYYANRAKKVDGRNNHRYWAGLAVMAAGIADDRQDLYAWGIDSFRIGVSQITPDGTLPLEMARRALALHYHLFASAPLVTMAELAHANGTDLYHVHNDALIRLVRRAVAGIDNPAFFAARAGVAQEPVRLDAQAIVWAVPFARRFPDPEISRLAARASSRSILYLGGLPPP